MLSPWALAVSFLAAAFAATLKAADFAHRLKLSNDEVTRLRQKIDAIQKNHDESVARTKAEKSESERILTDENAKLEKRIAELENQSSYGHKALTDYDPYN